jgi:DNA processing protein
VIAACDSCLRRGYLVGRLASSIAGLLNSPRRRAPGLLALDDDQLIAAVAGDAADEVRSFLDAFDVSAARRELDAHSLQAICRHARGFPEPLLDLDDPPAVLFAAGAPETVGALPSVAAAVAVVGTRKPSPYGLEVAYELGRGLSAAGVTVVSGLALGIDAAAHRGCLDGGGPAVAVLAGGPDVPYPWTNRRLYERIRERGVVLSELPPGQRAYRWAFPARNRIMAGLAAITVVVEAADPSGSLITSVFAADLGRTVAAVPGRITSRFSAGSNKLLAEGARIVTSAQDLLDELHGVGWQGPVSTARPGPDDSGGTGGAGSCAGRAATDPLEERVLDALEAGLGIEGVCAHSGLPAREARALLARLESTGRLRRDGLGGYRRTAGPRVAGRGM